MENKTKSNIRQHNLDYDSPTENETLADISASTFCDLHHKLCLGRLRTNEHNSKSDWSIVLHGLVLCNWAGAFGATTQEG